MGRRRRRRGGLGGPVERRRVGEAMAGQALLIRLRDGGRGQVGEI